MLNFTKTLYMGSAKSEGGGTPAPVDKTKYGITIDSIVGDVNDSGVLQAPTVDGNLVFNGVKEIGPYILDNGFSRTSVKTASFPDLETLNNNYSLSRCFLYANLSSISFPKLTSISGSNSMDSCFSNCKLTSVLFQELVTVSGSNAMQSAFSNNLLESIGLPKLKNLTGSSCCQFIFSYNNNLETAEFPALELLSGYGCLVRAFIDCVRLTSLYFPALKTTSFGSYNNQFDNMFSTSTGVVSGAFTMHFPSNLEATIQGLTGYPDFGATAGRLTLAYDLPATE